MSERTTQQEQAVESFEDIANCGPTLLSIVQFLNEREVEFTLHLPTSCISNGTDSVNEGKIEFKGGVIYE